MALKPNKSQHNRKAQKPRFAGLATLRFARICAKRQAAPS